MCSARGYRPHIPLIWVLLTFAACRGNSPSQTTATAVQMSFVTIALSC